MKGVILVAGKGTRLYPITRHIAKPLMPLANRMTLEFAFDQFREIGVTDLCVIVGENEPAMRETLGDGSNFGLNLTFVRQTEPKGLAHAISFAKEFVGDDDFAVFLGDAVYDRSLKPFFEQFDQAKCANLNLVMWVEDPRRFGVANLDGDRIVKLVEKPANPESNYAMAGMYIFSKALWGVLPDLQPSARGEYEITDAIQMMIDRGESVVAGIYEGNWFDTGTLDSYLHASQFLVGETARIGENVSLNSPFGQHVVIGDGSEVSAEFIEDSVVLPGAKVNVKGTIRHCILAGEVNSDSSLDSTIRWNSEDA